MAKKKDSGMHYPDPSNETGSGGPESPDMKGLDMYWGGWPEVTGKHLSEGDMTSTSNTESGDDILGTPTPGEPQAMKKK